MMFAQRIIRKRGILLKVLSLLFILLALNRIIFYEKKSNPTVDAQKDFKQKHEKEQVSKVAKEAPNKGINFINYVKKHNQEFRNYSKRDSTFKCLGKQNVFHENDRRGCIFKNICFKVSEEVFQFYNPTKRPVFYDKTFGPLMDFGNSFISMAPLWFFRDYFTPHVVSEEYPMVDTRKSDRIELEELHVFWSHNMPDFNFGHLVWEELGAIYLSLKRFNVDIKSNAVVLDAADYKRNKAKDLYEKFTSFFLPVITKEKVKNALKYIESFNKELVCFKKLMVPSFTRFFLDYRDSFNEGKEPLLFQLRNDILSFYRLDPFSKPKRHRILLNMKEESYNLGKGGNRTRFRSIANEQQVYQFLKVRYKTIQVDIINLAKLSLIDQLKEMLSTTIFITPNGGVSMSIPFLAIDSYAIIMDYYGGEKKAFFQYNDGDSASMEVSFWNLWTHVNKMYYQVFNEKDYVWDFERGKSYRDDTSIVVNLDRIEFMINEALHHYEV